jgi:hypothetical protein
MLQFCSLWDDGSGGLKVGIGLPVDSSILHQPQRHKLTGPTSSKYTQIMAAQRILFDTSKKTWRLEFLH